MQQLISHLSANGYTLTAADIKPDSEPHHFRRTPQDREKDAWYICHQSHSRGGELFYVLIYGDWHEHPNFHKVNSLIGGTADDNAYILKQIEKAIEKARKEQERRWEETSEAAGKAWANFSDATTSAYLARKQVKAYSLKQDGETLLVPVSDLNGKLWGYQRITDTEKKFLYGTKVKGNCHILGTPTTEALVCEGYATGASLYEATSIPTVIAFNAGNLPEVCASLLRQYPTLKLTVCADNDQWTPGNPGLKSAAKCGASKVIAPRFKSLDTRPTDFNDLHILEGLDTVKEQIVKDKSPSQFILYLGHSKDDYFYTSSGNREIVKISCASHNQAHLLSLMPLAYWEARFPGPKGTNWSAAQDFLMQQCRIKGIYDEENIRGIGVWHDDGRYVVNLGDGLFTNERIQIDDFQSRFVYEIGKHLPEPNFGPVDTRLLPSLMDTISFKRPDSRLYFLGFITLAPIAGALNWRPHIWLNGGSNTGKSTIMQVVSQLWGPWKHYFQWPTTEAGIRHTTRNNSKPILYDEFEAEDALGKMKMDAILELARQASSETDGHVAKGSPNGNAVTARPKFSAMFSSIRQPTLNEADRTRITDIELVWGNNPEQFDEFKRLAAQITAEFSNNYIARTIRLLPVLQVNVDIFWEVLRRKYSARIGQQYGTLLAAAWLAKFDEPITLDEARGVCEKLTLEDAKKNLAEREETECLELLMNSLIGLEGGGKLSVREMIAINNEGYQTRLKRHGIVSEDEQIWIASNHPELKRIFKDTRWAGGWSKSLARLPKAEQKSKYFKIADKGQAAHATGVPLNLVLEVDKTQ